MQHAGSRKKPPPVIQPILNDFPFENFTGNRAKATDTSTKRIYTELNQKSVTDNWYSNTTVLIILPRKFHQGKDVENALYKHMTRKNRTLHDDYWLEQIKKKVTSDRGTPVDAILHKGVGEKARPLFVDVKMNTRGKIP